MDKRIKIQKTVSALTFIFLAVWAGCFGVWLLSQSPRGTALGLSITIFLLFVLSILRCAKALINFWSQDLEAPLIPFFKDAKRTLGYALVFLFLIDLTLLVLSLKRFDTGSLPERFSLLWKSVTLDAAHYLNLAENGYANCGDVFLLVFFPLYPWLIRLFSLVLPDVLSAAMLLNHLLILADAFLFAALARRILPEAEARAALIFFFLSPAFYFTVFPMSEALFLFCTLAAVLAALNDRWLIAAAFGFAASLCRSCGILIVVFFAIELIQRWIRKQFHWTHLAALLLPLAGLGGYFLLNYFISGNPFQFLIYQKEHWSQQLSYFFNTTAYQWRYLCYYAESGQYRLFWGLMLPNFLTVFTALFWLYLGAGRIRISLIGYGLAYYVFTMGTTWLLSAPRYMACLIVLPLIAGSFASLPKRRWCLILIDAFFALIYLAFFCFSFPVY